MNIFKQLPIESPEFYKQWRTPSGFYIKDIKILKKTGAFLRLFFKGFLEKN